MRNGKEKKAHQIPIHREWTNPDSSGRLLKKLYPHGNTKKIAERLNRPLTAVRQKAYDIGMKTDVYQSRFIGMKLLRKLYPNAITQELAERLGRSAGSIKTKARQLGLRKTDSYLKAMRSRPRKRRKKKS